MSLAAKTKYEFKNRKKIKRIEARRRRKAKKVPKMTEDEKRKWEADERRYDADKAELVVADSLCALIKNNPNLHHLDLKSCGLTSFILEDIGSAVAKSRSLIGIHLSLNPGLTDEVKSHIFTRAKCKESDFGRPNIFDPRLIESIETRLPEEKKRRESIQ